VPPHNASKFLGAAGPEWVPFDPARHSAAGARAISDDGLNVHLLGAYNGGMSSDSTEKQRPKGRLYNRCTVWVD
jgi:hypothetical protein